MRRRRLPYSIAGNCATIQNRIENNRSIWIVFLRYFPIRFRSPAALIRNLHQFGLQRPQQVVRMNTHKESAPPAVDVDERQVENRAL